MVYRSALRFIAGDSYGNLMIILLVYLGVSVVVSGNGMCPNPSWVWRGMGLRCCQTPLSSGGVVGLIKWSTEEGRCLLENLSEMLMQAASLLLLLLLLYRAAQVLWLGSHVVVFGSCGLQTPNAVLWRRAFTDPRHNMPHVLWLSPASCLLLSWAVVILVRLGCWVWVLACDS